MQTLLPKTNGDEGPRTFIISPSSSIRQPNPGLIQVNPLDLVQGVKVNFSGQDKGPIQVRVKASEGIAGRSVQDSLSSQIHSMPDINQIFGAVQESSSGLFWNGSLQYVFVYETLDL